MQIKTTSRCHLTPVRMTIIKKPTNNKCLRRCGEKGTCLHYWWDYKLIWPLWRTVYRFLKKLKIELSYNPPKDVLRAGFPWLMRKQGQGKKIFDQAVFLGYLLKINNQTHTDRRLQTSNPLSERNLRRIWKHLIGWYFGKCYFIQYPMMPLGFTTAK